VFKLRSDRAWHPKTPFILRTANPERIHNAASFSGTLQRSVTLPKANLFVEDNIKGKQPDANPGERHALLSAVSLVSKCDRDRYLFIREMAIEIIRITGAFVVVPHEFTSETCCLSSLDE
jgi:hypothetical protein